MEKPTLDSNVSWLSFVGPSYTTRLQKLGIITLGDLLYHLPFRYLDYSVLSKINQLQEGETVTVQGKVLEIKNQYTRGGFALQKAKIQDETGIAEAMWFNQRFLPQVIHLGDLVNLSGKVKKGKLESPDYEVIRGETVHTGRLVPIYPETAGISSKWLRSRINAALKQIEIIDYLDNQEIDLTTALAQVHFPDNLEMAQKAKERLAFDELLISQLESKLRKKELESQVVANKFKIIDINDKLKKFVENLPFQLTSAQKTAIDQIYKDLSRDIPMNRLLQGDVGSGKTVVAALAMLAAYLNNYQAILMAPTEILATQHYETLRRLLAPLRIGVGLATSSTKNYSAYDVVVGTHALLNIDFKKVGLVVIDESHRFGVEQRAKLTAKGINPHVLTMTATPIPRTVALTLYGDLDISIIYEMPHGRRPIKTWVVPEHKRRDAYNWIRKHQAFIICPFIEEPAWPAGRSESLQTVKSAKAEFARLQKDVFPDLKLGLIHGRLKANEKNEILEKFRQGELNILVATPIVEVGIDIPTATVMVIEGADRFGLAQLHQLRGRVGRGETQSYCLLFGENLAKLKHLEAINNGLELSEIDLKIRGPGERFGFSQHGKWNLKIADFSNLELVEKANSLAEKVLEKPSDFSLLLDSLNHSRINVIQN